MPAGNEVSGFKILPSKPLISLHKSLLAAAKRHLSGRASREMFYAPRAIGPGTIRTVNLFRTKTSGKNYFPHITLGYGRLQPEKITIRFEAQGFSLCQLGNHCTCRKILKNYYFKTG